MENDSNEDREYLEEYERINGGNTNQVKQDKSDQDDEDYANEFEDSPRQKVGSQGLAKESKDLENKQSDRDQDSQVGNDDQDEEDDVDEDEVIDAAERIFIRIAEEIISQEHKSVREIFADHILET